MKNENIDASMVHISVNNGNILVDADRYPDMVKFIIDGFEFDLNREYERYFQRIQSTNEIGKLNELQQLIKERAAYIKTINDTTLKEKFDFLIEFVDDKISSLPDTHYQSLNFHVNNDEFKNRLYDLMLKIPIIEKTEKDMLFFALFGEPLKRKFDVIKISNGRKDLLIYLFYKFSQINPYDNKSLSCDIRTNAVKLFDFQSDRLPNLKRYPKYYEKIDNLFENFPPNE